MMREILFRAKDSTGKWHYGDYIHLHKTTYCVKEDYEADKDNDIHNLVFERMTDWGLPNQHFRVDVVPKTIGQFTGLTDKNGTKIFEGDIVRNTDDNNIAVVSWYEEHAAFMLYSKKQNKIYFLYDNNFKLIEVIGNIHDNPELLKEDSK